MSHYSQVGQLLAPSATGTQSVTGLGFQPKAIIFWSAYVTGVSAASAIRSFGVASSSAAQWVISGCSDHAADPSNTGTGMRNDACIHLLSNGTPTVDGYAGLTSFDADGFTLTWADAPAASGWKVNYLAIGGTDISAKAGTITSVTAAGSQPVTGVGFQPGFVLCAHSIGTTWPATYTGTPLGLGVASGTASARQAASFSNDLDAKATTECETWQKSGDIILGMASGADYMRANLSALGADGFTLNWTTTSSGREIGYLAINGGSHFVGLETEKATTGTQATTGVGFQPGQLVGFSLVQATASTAVSVARDSRFYFGAADPDRDAYAIATGSVDNGASAVATRRGGTDVYDLITIASGAQAAAAAVSSYDADGFTLNYTVSSGAAREFIYWVSNATVVTPAGGGSTSAYASIPGGYYF